MAPIRQDARFTANVEPYRRELTAHCYRMLGSLDDAEDLVQETMLRAWRGLEAYQGRASMRTWLYRIATNACLDALAARARRVLPEAGVAPADPGVPLPPPRLDPVWVGPLPGELAAGLDHDPAARYDRRESITLAFVAALQHLPPRQRAVLILRDVLAWRAREVAELLGESLGAVNSLLFRARRTMAAEHRPPVAMAPVAGADADLLRRYVAAWEAADVPALVALLREDALYSMPPLPVWFEGRAAIERFLRAGPLAGAGAGRWRMLPAEANAQPALATYELVDGAYRPAALSVIDLDHGLIAQVTTFLDPGPVLRAGCPEVVAAAP